MDAMMYKIEGEDLYLIGTSEHSMIGKFIDQIIPEEKLPSACIGCKACTDHCPQSFLIPKYMKELAEMLKEL